jgi:hypothetical protein
MLFLRRMFIIAAHCSSDWWITALSLDDPAGAASCGGPVLPHDACIWHITPSVEKHKRFCCQPDWLTSPLAAASKKASGDLSGKHRPMLFFLSLDAVL